MPTHDAGMEAIKIGDAKAAVSDTPETDAADKNKQSGSCYNGDCWKGEQSAWKFARSLERRLRESEEQWTIEQHRHKETLERAERAEAALATARRDALEEVLAWKPNTPQLENAMTYAWEQAIKQMIRGPWQTDGIRALEAK